MAGVLAALATSLAAAAPASGAGLLSTSVSAPAAVARDCHAKLLDSGSGYAQKTVIDARGRARRRASRRRLRRLGPRDLRQAHRPHRRPPRTASARASSPRASPAAAASSSIQACRRSGAAATASLSAFSVAVPSGTAAQRASLVRVQTPTPASKTLLNLLGLDLTEHGRDDYVEVVAYGAGDLEKLRKAGLQYTTEVADLTVQARSDRAADRAFAQRVGTSALPSGRTGYRHLYDYEAEMKALAAVAPELVKPITLNHPTRRGPPGPRHRDHQGRRSSPTASRSSSRWACTTRASGRPASTRWSGRSSSSAATAATPS